MYKIWTFSVRTNYQKIADQKPLKRTILWALQQYKVDPYLINDKLRGVNREPLTKMENKILEYILAAPRKILTEDTTIYRGISAYHFDPIKEFKVGKIYQEKGFTALTLKKELAIRFQNNYGYLLEVFLPKGTEYLDIDSILTDNVSRLNRNCKFFYAESKNPRHEWVLFPGSNFLVKNFSDTSDKLRDHSSLEYKFKSRGSFEFEHIIDKTQKPTGLILPDNRYLVNMSK